MNHRDYFDSHFKKEYGELNDRTYVTICFYMAHPLPLFNLFSDFSYKFYNKLMRTMSGPGIRTHNLLITNLLI